MKVAKKKTIEKKFHRLNENNLMCKFVITKKYDFEYAIKKI